MNGLSDVFHRRDSWSALICALAGVGWLASDLINPAASPVAPAQEFLLRFAPTWAVDAWFSIFVLVSLLSVAGKDRLMDMVRATMGLTTWSYLFFGSLALGPPFPRAIGCYLAMWLLCGTADFGSWQRWRLQK